MKDTELRNKVPAHMIGGIDRYVEHHIEPGGFLRAVLENNLKEALGRADMENRYALFDIVSYIYNECPFQCWGSPEKVGLWLGEITLKIEDAE
jgi:hypothetical protein